MADFIINKIQNDIEETIDRHGSILGIPRKEDDLLGDIEKILLLVKEKKEVNSSELTESIMGLFGVSYNTARSVRTILERANLLLRGTNKKIRLTNMAENYFKTNNAGYLIKGFVYNFFGFLEILLLVDRHKPKRRNDIQVDWEKLYELEFGERGKKTYSTQLGRIFAYLHGFKLINVSEGYIGIDIEAYNKLETIDFW